MDELENIRKRAKRLVRDHHERRITIAPRLRAHVPRFAELSDREILEARFTLSDAQQSIAAELGFAAWEELVAAPEPPAADLPLRPTAWRAFPQVFVRNVTDAIGWYQHVLSCELDYEYGSPPFHAQLSRNGAALNLRLTGHRPWSTQPPEPELLAVRFEVDDVKSLYLEVRERQAILHHPLRREPWGQRTFTIEDPDGNLLSFGSSMPSPSPSKGLQ